MSAPIMHDGSVLVLHLSEAETAKLRELAAARNRTPECCIRDMIAACQPGGSGWVHPSIPTRVAP